MVKRQTQLGIGLALVVMFGLQTVPSALTNPISDAVTVSQSAPDCRDPNGECE
jgi:hypothetical protein